MPHDLHPAPMDAADPNSAPAAPSIDPAEIARFSAVAKEWWSATGKFRPLHWLNPVRLQYIKEHCVRHFGLDAQTSRPLEGLSLLDVGCGGGLLCEPLHRLGARVTGLDAGIANIKTATVHAQEGGLDIDYRAGSIEGLAASGEQFDVVLSMEVIEHVNDPAAFIAACARTLKPGGLMFLSTINRTQKARALALFAAERVLNWLPPGTHTYEKLVTPEELDSALAKAGLQAGPATGVSYNPLSGQWRLTGDLSMNYMLNAVWAQNP